LRGALEEFVDQSLIGLGLLGGKAEATGLPDRVGMQTAQKTRHYKGGRG
jgi:hypothetical protein